MKVIVKTVTGARIEVEVEDENVTMIDILVKMENDLMDYTKCYLMWKKKMKNEDKLKDVIEQGGTHLGWVAESGNCQD